MKGLKGKRGKKAVCRGGGGGGGWQEDPLFPKSPSLVSLLAFVVDCFYVTLSSALEQSHCVLVACDSK